MVNEIRRKKKEKEKVDKESEYDLLKINVLKQRNLILNFVCG